MSRNPLHRDALDVPSFQWYFLHPKYWISWVGIGLLWLAAVLPLSLVQQIGRGLGWLTYKLGIRKNIAEKNLEYCFPEKSAEERHELLKEHYASMGMALLESGAAWFWPSWKVAKYYQVEGEEYVRDALSQGGIVLLSMHFVTLEVGARMFGQFIQPGIGMYRPHKNPVFDWAQFHGRIRSNKYLISRKGGSKAMLRALRQGEVVWYAPDQDYGRKRSVFVPFFSIEETATLPSTALFGKFGKVVPFVQTRLPNAAGYKLSFRPALENFPTGDQLADARRINALVEDEIRLQPEQYLWTHRRFKTRPTDKHPPRY